MTPQEYFEQAKHLWQTYVPRSGQAATVQGELIRAIEKIRDEAQRNGNINFNERCHVTLVEYLRSYLCGSGIFDATVTAQAHADLDLLLQEENPYLDDDVYDRITERIVDWYRHHPEPVPHTRNPDLYC